ncbi:MAG TPA: lysozyme inhibitor LprI family protein [Telluria sp.]|nr:lysozyme inhibitor LprI family protein [Telluria sp.]
MATPDLRLPLLALPMLLFAHGAAAVAYPNLSTVGANAQFSAHWYQQCVKVRNLRPPARDLPARGAGGSCDAAALYYETLALDAPGDHDWKKVRDCAFRNNDSGVLMMLYANGAGVTQNLALATRYACSIESSTGEMKNRVARLARKKPREHVDMCADAATGPAMGYCASVHERSREKARGDQLAALSKDWSAKEQLGLEMASKAAHFYAQHRHDYETDLSAPMRKSMQVDALAAELERFVGDVHDFEKGKLPQFSEGEFKALDDKMNEVYQQFMQSQPGPDSYLGTIRKTGVEKTQRAWLAYRDAMELYGSIRYPSAPSSGLRALLTSRRLRQLTELADAAAGR